jgi:hypothetical protein
MSTVVPINRCVRFATVRAILQLADISAKRCDLPASALERIKDQARHEFHDGRSAARVVWNTQNRIRQFAQELQA